MNKSNIIQEHFQKIDHLTLSNKTYQKCVDDLCEWLLRNDKVQNDLTSKLLLIKDPKEITARIVSNESLTVGGLAEAEYLLSTFTEINYKGKQFDGMSIDSKETILELHGTAAEILAYERSILNVMQRLSGIATATHSIVSEIETLKIKKKPFIAATRKTPWTLLDKKAVALGGGGTHRLNLSDGVLVKDNHLLILKDVYGLKNEPEVVVKTLEILSQDTKGVLLEIEVEDHQSIEALLTAWSSLRSKNTLSILLDNFSATDAKRTLDKLKKKHDTSKVVFEAAGGINQNNILEWAQTGVDVISLGSLTHSVHAVDLSLEII